jgi:hypothetical protein
MWKRQFDDWFPPKNLGTVTSGCALRLGFPSEVQLRLILVIAVIALGVDALYHNGAYTQSAFKQASILTEQFRDRLDDTPRTGSDRETATTTKQL